MLPAAGRGDFAPFMGARSVRGCRARVFLNFVLASVMTIADNKHHDVF